MSASVIPAGIIADAVVAAKMFLRIEGNDEDALIGGCVAAAIAIGEAFTGQALVARSFEDVLPRNCDWQSLGAEPVGEITGVTGLPTGAPAFTLTVASYAIDIDAAGRGWVRIVAPDTPARVLVSYTAGLATSWDALPAPIAQGVVMLVGHLYADREAEAAPPVAVGALWRPYRRMMLAPAEHRS